MYINSLGAPRARSVDAASGIRPLGRVYGTNSSTNQNTVGKASGTDSFASAIQKAIENQNRTLNSTTASEDMVITQSSYYKAPGDTQVPDKPKEEMTMEEYKQWFRREVSDIQAEMYSRSPYLSDTLVIKEEAFEKMKADPKWEESVIDQIKKHYTAGETTGSKGIGYQMIGASTEACYENKIPVNVSSSYTANNLLANSLLAQTGYQNGQTGQSWLQSYLLQSMVSGLGSYGLSSYMPYSMGLPGFSTLTSGYSDYTASGLGLLGYSPYGMGGTASTAYQNVMNNILTSSLLGSQLI